MMEVEDNLKMDTLFTLSILNKEIFFQDNAATRREKGGGYCSRGLKHHGYQYAMPNGIQKRISINRLCLTATDLKDNFKSSIEQGFKRVTKL
ncbi:hypothetical protein FACS189431_6170 [Alphaproteobacteria bacterium]|nr:hypothetical protein FACS189431_6170 [Alphaproteobacteria bacterium]